MNMPDPNKPDPNKPDPNVPDNPNVPDTILDNAKLVIVAERSSEIAAKVLVNVLADEKIRAVAVGGFTAGFRAEAPGWVQVKVFEGDAERARTIISEIKQVP